MIDLRKLSQLLNPQGTIPNQQPSPIFPSGPSIDNPELGMNQDEELNQALMQLLQPKDEQYDRFAQMLQMMPQREAFKPSKTRTIGAFLGGLGAGGPQAYQGGAALGYKSNLGEGLKIQRGILDEPYDRALSDWGDRAKPTLEAAKLENTKNVNSRIAGSNIKSAQLKEQSEQRMLDRNETLARQGDEKNDIARQKLEIDRKKQQAAEFKNSHPDFKLVTRQDGQLMFVNPKDPSAKPVDTGLKGTDISDMEKINLQHEGRMEEISARGAEQRKTEEARPSTETSEKGWSVQDNYDPDTGKWIGKIRVNSITGASQPIKGAQGPKTPPKQTIESETQKKQGLINKANQVISSNPELKSYIVFDREGVHILPRGLGGYSPFYGQEKATKAYNMLFGEEKPQSSNQTKQPPKAPAGWKYVAKPGGGWTAVEDK